MKQEILNITLCPRCGSSPLRMDKALTDQYEISNGTLVCSHCQAEYAIQDGIIDFLHNANENVLRERKAMDDDDYIADEYGNKYKITNEIIEKFKDTFLTLPEGDGSYFFKKGGSFQSTAEASGRFYSALEDLHLTGRERILEIGACFSYASFKFAQKGCRVVALDISNYLKVSRLFIPTAYFDRIFADMHAMPFQDNSFDIVFGSAVLHHTGQLDKVFGEIYRVLKAAGRLVLINEPSRGVLERIHPVFEKMQNKGFGDTSYTIPEWKRSVKTCSFKKLSIEFLSLADDYITKHKNRGEKVTFKVKLARFFVAHRCIEKIVLSVLLLPRILFRPRSWRLIAYK